jgi:Flp pilus assembly protein TadG
MRGNLMSKVMKKLASLRSSFKDDDKGLAAIEFGFIVPFMFIMFFGLVDLTNFITVARKATNSAAVVADLVAQNNVAITPATMDDYMKAVMMIHSEFNNNSALIKVEVAQYRPNAAVTAGVSRRWNYSWGSGPACSPAAVSTTGFGGLVTAGNDLIVARVCFQHRPLFGTFGNNTLIGASLYNIAETTVTRPRSRQSIDCPTCTQN